MLCPSGQWLHVSVPRLSPPPPPHHSPCSRWQKLCLDFTRFAQPWLAAASRFQPQELTPPPLRCFCSQRGCFLHGSSLCSSVFKLRGISTEVQTRAGDEGGSQVHAAPPWPGPALPASVAHAGGSPRAPVLRDSQTDAGPAQGQRSTMKGGPFQLHGLLPSNSQGAVPQGASGPGWPVRKCTAFAEASAGKLGVGADKDMGLSAV